MQRAFEITRDRIRRSIERERVLEKHFEAASLRLWPWRDSSLVGLVALLALLDYVSTYAFLELSGNRLLYESGALARWALQRGGITLLLWVDVAAVSALILLATGLRFFQFRFGFKGYGRTCFVVLLLPYTVITLAVVFNNIVLVFL
jgi:hypothetical protein